MSFPPTNRTSSGQCSHLCAGSPARPALWRGRTRLGDSNQTDQRLIYSRFAEANKCLVRGFRHRSPALSPANRTSMGTSAASPCWPRQAIAAAWTARVRLFFGQAKHGVPRSHIGQVRQYTQKDQLTGGLHGGKR
jgi:hypothetical protein